MKISKFLLIGAFFMTTSVCAQSNYEKDPESCTSIMVGKKATVDGSVITSHTCDSWYRTWVDMVPAQKYQRDITMAIYDGRMHIEWISDMTKVTA